MSVYEDGEKIYDSVIEHYGDDEMISGFNISEVMSVLGVEVDEYSFNAYDHACYLLEQSRSKVKISGLDYFVK